LVKVSLVIVCSSIGALIVSSIGLDWSDVFAGRIGGLMSLFNETVVLVVIGEVDFVESWVYDLTLIVVLGRRVDDDLVRIDGTLSWVLSGLDWLNLLLCGSLGWVLGLRRLGGVFGSPLALGGTSLRWIC
jgi:hypothetical protein